MGVCWDANLRHDAPGTGKSQTITNLIATPVKEGKKVMFVAEKMAALEVVKRRLDNVDLGDMCLELHDERVHFGCSNRILPRCGGVQARRTITDGGKSHGYVNRRRD